MSQFISKKNFEQLKKLAYKNAESEKRNVFISGRANGRKLFCRLIWQISN